MKIENINQRFLDAVLTEGQIDSYYHLGVASNDPLLEQMREIRAVIMAGSGSRMVDFAQSWSTAHGDADIVAFPKEDRFTTRYTAGVLFVSHGMGTPSASIAVQELMRLVYFLKRGNLDALDEIFWARVGTSGAVGVPAGTIVISTEAVLVDLQPFRLFDGHGGLHWFDGHFPQGIADIIVAANSESGIPIAQGKTVTTNEFFIEQFRLDGAITLTTESQRAEWLQQLSVNGVRNIDMEGAMFAAYMNAWGFPNFAMVCSTLLDRLQDDQVTASKSELKMYDERSANVIFNYLREAVS
jgi:uridine phosphorylase